MDPKKLKLTEDMCYFVLMSYQYEWSNVTVYCGLEKEKRKKAKVEG